MQRGEVLEGVVVEIVHVKGGNAEVFEGGEAVEDAGATDEAGVGEVFFHVDEDVFFEDTLRGGVEEEGC